MNKEIEEQIDSKFISSLWLIADNLWWSLCVFLIISEFFYILTPVIFFAFQIISFIQIFRIYLEKWYYE